MLTIGQMSKVCGVSVKTLRHYEKIGLLRPRRTDKANGYRYYEDVQIRSMLLIGRLKRYGFSLTDIQYLMTMKNPKELLGQLQKQKFRLEHQMSHLSLMVGEMRLHLEEFERTGDIMSYQNHYKVELKEAKEQVLLTQRQKMSMEEFGTYYGKIYERIARERLTPDGVVLALYHDEEFDPACCDIELAVGIREREKADTIMPAGLCAVTVHKGAYSGLPDAWGALVSWIHANGCKAVGIPYEVYIKNRFHNLPMEEWVTELFFPVTK